MLSNIDDQQVKVLSNTDDQQVKVLSNTDEQQVKVLSNTEEGKQGKTWREAKARKSTWSQTLRKITHEPRINAEQRTQLMHR